MLIAKYIQNIKPSATLALAALAKSLKDKGIDVINLTTGEPDFDTPEHIKQAAIKAINEGKTKYTQVDGIPELKKAICNFYGNRAKFDPDNVIVGVGAKQVIYNCLMATVEAGDEVLIPAPYWVSYPDMVNIVKGTPVIVDCNAHNFKLTPELLEKAITPKTKWLILNSPNNPSGMKYSREELKSLAEVLARRPNVYILSDDIYESITFEDEVYSLIDVAPEIANRIFVVNGVSKAYAMTGWRIGFGIGDKNLIKAIKILQSQSTSNPCSISQYAALEALTADQSDVEKGRISFLEKRDFTCDLISQIDDLNCIKPEGAFYAFVDCTKLLGKKTASGKIIKDSHEFSSYLLEEALVAVVPGDEFGSPGHFRISYATSKDIIKESIARIAKACAKLKG